MEFFTEGFSRRSSAQPAPPQPSRSTFGLLRHYRRASSLKAMDRALAGCQRVFTLSTCCLRLHTKNQLLYFPGGRLQDGAYGIATVIRHRRVRVDLLLSIH